MYDLGIIAKNWDLPSGVVIQSLKKEGGKKGFRFGVIPSAECFVLGIECDECDAKDQSRNNMKRPIQLFMGGVVGRLPVTYLMYYLQHEILWSEAYEVAHSTKLVQKSGLTSTCEVCNLNMIMRYI